MITSSILAVLMILTVNADDAVMKKKPLTFGPYAICCDIPPLGDITSKCVDNSDCRRNQCAFEELGFLSDKYTVNKETYKNYLLDWAGKNKDWSAGVNRTISDCIDKDPEKGSEPFCNADDMYACTGISMILECPKKAWKCGQFYE